jgi:hypothetical protein
MIPEDHHFEPDLPCQSSSARRPRRSDDNDLRPWSSAKNSWPKRLSENLDFIGWRSDRIRKLLWRQLSLRSWRRDALESPNGATRPVAFRKGRTDLLRCYDALLRESLGSDLYSGVIYVFQAKRVDRVKLLLGSRWAFRIGLVYGIKLRAESLSDHRVAPVKSQLVNEDGSWVSPLRRIIEQVRAGQKALPIAKLSSARSSLQAMPSPIAATGASRSSAKQSKELSRTVGSNGSAIDG